MAGKLSNAQYQDRVREIQRRRQRQLEHDIRAMLEAPWGRRLAYWLIFELGRLDAPSFAPEIKDGVCAAMHQAHAEGFRAMASEFLARARDLAPDCYLLMMQEQIAARQADLALEEHASESAGVTES